MATGAKDSGKWYVEVKIDHHDQAAMVGLIANNRVQSMVYHDNLVCCSGHEAGLPRTYPSIASSDLMTSGAVLGFALDVDGGSLDLYVDGLRQGSMSDLQPNEDFSQGPWLVGAGDGSSAENTLRFTVQDGPAYWGVPDGYRYWYAS